MRMHPHHLPEIVLALLTAVVVASGGIAPTRAGASPAGHAVATASEGTKVTLHETSIDGPGFAFAAIAWTGTDAAHHLNIRTGTDGLHFPTKTTLPETSPVGPALIMQPGGPLVFAWTGTDANHSLNVEFGPPNSTKLTLHESSFAAPAIAFGIVGDHQELLLAWTGIDANHSLNVLPITRAGTGGLTPGKKTVLAQFSSDAGPSLFGLGDVVGSPEFVLGWSVRGTQRLNLAESTDGADFTSALGAGLPQTSVTAPQFLQPNGSTSGCIAWTGTDAAHHLNVQCTTQFPQFPDPAHTKTVLSETALGAPGFDSNEIAWTGTDLAHHLNVAQLQGL
jgi:hypothetical protein